LTKVLNVGDVVDAQTNTYPVLLSAANSAGGLREGQTVIVEVPLEKHPGVLVVPTTALVPDPEHAENLMVCQVADHKLKRVAVTVGIQTKGLAEIQGAIQAGSWVVAKGGYGLPDGTQVNPAP
jgi:multidrug efflux pump subunit AcrA (membrane-fusion protein)